MLRRPRIHHPGLLLTIAAALVTGYLAFYVLLRVQPILFPGNPLDLGGVGQVVGIVPGFEAVADPESVPARRITVLLVGLDRREDEPDPGRTDSIIVATVDPRTREATLISIPRDTVVRIPADGGTITDRINTAYHIGELAENGSGIELLERTIRQNFGIPIDHHVLINFEGFKTLIDAVGGVEIDVEQPIGYPSGYSEDDQAAFNVIIPEGHQHLDGTLALAYARFRGGSDGDLGRVKRQQKVLLAVRSAAAELGWLADPVTAWNGYRDTVETDVNKVQLPGYALLATQIDMASVSTRSFGENGLVKPVTRSDGAQVLLPDLVAIRKLLAPIFGDDLRDADTEPIAIDLSANPAPVDTPEPQVPAATETPATTKTPRPRRTPKPAVTPTRKQQPTPRPTRPAARAATPTPAETPSRTPRPSKTPQP